MAVRKIKEDIYEVGVQHHDRLLFDELIPTPEGTSYNSYLVLGENKNALIDTVDPSKSDILIRNLKNLGVDSIDYIISNHAEQDHSGAIPKLLELFPDAKIVTNKKAKELLIDLLHLPEKAFYIVENEDELDLGGRRLKFYLTPWVHWPETMIAYLVEDKILFTCDLFGSHYATSEIFVENEKLYESAKRYYAEIMMPFRNFVKKHLELVKTLDVEIIAPSHGPVYKNPEFIIKAYEDWTGDSLKNKVTLAYVSMHGSTEKIANALYDDLVEAGIEVDLYNLTVCDHGKLFSSLLDSATFVIASPTVLGGLHPTAIHTLALMKVLRPKVKFVGVVGSYSWGGRAPEQVKDLLQGLKVEFLPPVMVKGLPKETDFEKLKKLSELIAEKHNKVVV